MSRRLSDRAFSRHAIFDPPVVPDSDDIDFDSVERQTLDLLRDDHFQAMAIEQLHRSWHCVTYEELNEAEGFFFTIKVDELVGESLNRSSKPHYLTASTLIFTKEELVVAVENPYSIMRGVSRLLGHKLLKFTIESVQFKLNSNHELLANIIFDKTDVNRIHGGIAYRIRGVDFVLMSNASLTDLREVQVPQGVEKLTVGFSLKNLTVLRDTYAQTALPTGEANMSSEIRISPVSSLSQTRRSRMGSFILSGTSLLGGSNRTNISRPSLRKFNKSVKEDKG